MAWPALAQQGLRGEVAEDVVNRDLLNRPKLVGRRSPLDPPISAEARAQAAEAARAGYVPISQGAVPDEDAETPEETGTLFPAARTEDDTFSESAPADAARAAPGKARRAAEEKAANARSAAKPAVVDEEDQTTGTVRQASVDSDDEERNKRIETDNARTEAIEGLDTKAEENPYAPIGLRLGTFNVLPTLETGVTWTSNANYSTTPKAAFLSETTLRLNAVSDWSRHSAIINAFGTYRRTISGEEVNDPSAGIDATFNLDIKEDLRGTARLGYALKRESADSPVVLPVTVSRPLSQTLTGSLGIEKDVGKFRFAVTGDVERIAYGDAELGGGGVLSQRERNATLFTGTLRAGYEISPAITPFAEIELGRRVYDVKIDSNGYARSADRLAARIGTELSLGEKLQGELSAGWINESFDDALLNDISGLSANAELNWSPERGTTVGLNASTTVEGSTTAGESGSLLYSGNLTLAREIRANLTLNTSVGAAFRDYAGSSDNDLTFNAEAGLTWWLNRYAGLTGRYRYEQLTSSLPNRDTTTNSVYLGLKLQR
ncbi:MAG: outer membrane beta-barrel protein [Mesorhizobium sp.]|nr:outer membrane beta-barrel protein [Mesorhizobium sp.]